MASKKKIEDEVIEEKELVMDPTAGEVEIKKVELPKKEEKKDAPVKFAIGSIVFISKDAEADLNGFKLFPQYKKYTYTVEAYDPHTNVYTLRRLNLSLKLKEADILAPDEKAGSSIARKQF
ncbi:MAG: hypothetical protein K2P14_10475 [Anaeroplasmataceae bacterium]|nr:hypothetical protein [Anaeroplasmataceae bacterium]